MNINVFQSQCKGKLYTKLPVSKIPTQKSLWLMSIKRDGNYVQVHINQRAQTCIFYTSGGHKFFNDFAEREFLRAVKFLDINELILEAEYNFGSDGKLGCRPDSAKITTYRTNSAKGVNNKGNIKDQFRVFDIINLDMDFAHRYDRMLSISDTNCVKVGLNTVMTYENALEKAKDLVDNQGYEGVVLKSPSHRVKSGKRVNDIIKIKFYPTVTVKVLKELDGEGEFEGMIGSLRVVTPAGIEFQVSSGLTHPDRKKWGTYIDKFYEVTYEQLMKGKPQQPVIDITSSL